MVLRAGGGRRVIYLVGGTFCPVGTASRAEMGRARRERDPGLDELGS